MRPTRCATSSWPPSGPSTLLAPSSPRTVSTGSRSPFPSSVPCVRCRRRNSTSTASAWLPVARSSRARWAAPCRTPRCSPARSSSTDTPLYRNARLGLERTEELFVHTVAKYPEPGCYWLPYGSSDDGQEVLPEVGDALTARAAAALEAHRTKSPLAGPALPDDLCPTRFRRRGNPVCAGRSRLLRQRRKQPRRECRPGNPDCGRRPTVRPPPGGRPATSTCPCRSCEIASCSATTTDLARALVKVRPGEDSVGVSNGERHALFLPQVSVHENWSRAEVARQLLRKAKIDGGATAWTAYRTSSWLRRGSRTYSLRGAFPARPAPTADLDTVRATLGRLSDYLLGQITEEGLPAYCYDPVFGRTDDDRHRRSRAARPDRAGRSRAVLQRSDLIEAAARGLDARRCRPSIRRTRACGAAAGPVQQHRGRRRAGAGPPRRRPSGPRRRPGGPRLRTAATHAPPRRSGGSSGAGERSGRHDFLPGLVLWPWRAIPSECRPGSLARLVSAPVHPADPVGHGRLASAGLAPGVGRWHRAARDTGVRRRDGRPGRSPASCARPARSSPIST